MNVKVNILYKKKRKKEKKEIERERNNGIVQTALDEKCRV